MILILLSSRCRSILCLNAELLQSTLESAQLFKRTGAIFEWNRRSYIAESAQLFKRTGAIFEWNRRYYIAESAKLVSGIGQAFKLNQFGT